MYTLTSYFAFRQSSIRDIERIIRDNLKELRGDWDEFCGNNNP